MHTLFSSVMCDSHAYSVLSGGKAFRLCSFFRARWLDLKKMDLPRVFSLRLPPYSEIDGIRTYGRVVHSNPVNGSPDNGSIWLLVQVLASPMLRLK